MLGVTISFLIIFIYSDGINMVYIFLILCAMFLVEYLEYYIGVKTPRKKVIHRTHYKSATGAYMRRANRSSVAAEKDYYK